jgi:hypothetical protein
MKNAKQAFVLVSSSQKVQHFFAQKKKKGAAFPAMLSSIDGSH